MMPNPNDPTNTNSPYPVGTNYKPENIDYKDEDKVFENPEGDDEITPSNVKESSEEPKDEDFDSFNLDKVDELEKAKKKKKE